MSTSYEFNTAAYSVEELSDRFCEALELERVKPLSPVPISNESWWASAASLEASEFEDEASRLQAVETFTSMSFEPRKSLSWEQQTQGLVRIVKTVLSLLSRDPESSGFLLFYDEIIVLEKRRNREIVISPRLIDPDDLDDQRAFAPILKGFPIEQIEQL